MFSSKIKTRLIRRSEATEKLGISARSFWKHWNVVFTDPRPPEDRRHKIQRCVFEDELSTAMEFGGRLGDRAKAAVLEYRRKNGRL